MSKRSPLTPAERKQILKMHGDGYTQLMIANHVGVHRHSVANVVAKAGDASPAELRAEIARLKAELAKRDAELETLRRRGTARVVAALGLPTAAEQRPLTPAEQRRALSADTPPRPAPPEVAAHGIAALAQWRALEIQRHRDAMPVPYGPYHGWSEVKMRVWLAEGRAELAGLAASFHP